MKNLYYTNTGFVALDAETNEFHKMESQREAISRILIADDDMHIVLDKDGRHYEMDAEKGDLIILFYDSDFPKPVIAVKSEDWIDNINTYNDAMQKRKEKYASKKCCSDCCGCVPETPTACAC